MALCLSIRAAVSVAAGLLALTACNAGMQAERSSATESDVPPAASEHDHSHDGAEGLPPAGDGTAAYQVGYTLRDVRLPRAAGEPGRLGFVIENHSGGPQTAFLTELSKQMHVYVVRDDLAVFRHVHPTMGPDGRWSGQLTLPEPGRYRVITEFTAEDEGGYGDFVMLGRHARVPGAWTQRATPPVDGAAADWGVEATVEGEVTAGDDGELRIRLTTPKGDAVQLGEYLGVPAHLTGFHTRTGAAVHMHPLGAPTTTDGAVELAFHTRLPELGTYVLFLQVQVDGFLHTLPLTVAAS